MAKKWSKLRKQMSKDAQARSRSIADCAIEEIEALNHLRAALQLTQEQIAELIETSQANVSKLERQSDMQISTLQRYVAALGGKLKLVAEVDGKEYRIHQFDAD